MKIGITGQIGAGKSTAARMLQAMGAFLIDADQIGREVVERHPELRRDLAAAFGRDVLDQTGRLKRDLLAQRAFADDPSKRKLDRLVHPHLLRDLRSQLRLSSRNHKVVLIDATLVFDWGFEKELDLTLVVYAPRRIRLARLAEKGVSPADALARQKRQLSLAEYRRRADIAIDNRGTRSELRLKLHRLWLHRIAKAIDR